MRGVCVPIHAGLSLVRVSAVDVSDGQVDGLPFPARSERPNGVLGVSKGAMPKPPDQHLDPALVDRAERAPGSVIVQRPPTLVIGVGTEDGGICIRDLDQHRERRGLPAVVAEERRDALGDVREPGERIRDGLPHRRIVVREGLQQRAQRRGGAERGKRPGGRPPNDGLLVVEPGRDHVGIHRELAHGGHRARSLPLIRRAGQAPKGVQGLTVGGTAEHCLCRPHPHGRIRIREQFAKGGHRAVGRPGPGRYGRGGRGAHGRAWIPQQGQHQGGGVGVRIAGRGQRPKRRGTNGGVRIGQGPAGDRSNVGGRGRPQDRGCHPPDRGIRILHGIR